MYNSSNKKLKPGGKILVVSFHSLEDKIVNFFFSHYSKNKSRPNKFLKNKIWNVLKSIKIVFKPSKKEIKYNKRSII